MCLSVSHEYVQAFFIQDSYGWERKEYYQNHDFNKLCKNYWIFNQNEDVMDNSPQYYNFS